MSITSARKTLSGIRHRPSWWIAALAVFANLLVITLVGLSLDASYRQYHERAAITSYNTNHLVSQSIAGEIDRIDLGLLAVVDEVARQRHGRQGAIDGPALEEFLSRLQARLPMVDSLHVANADGLLICGAGGLPQTGISIDDRDYFIALRDNSGLGLFISAAMDGKISHKWALHFARRLTAADGSFGGIVNAAVTIAWFDHKLQGLDVGAHGAVVMRGDASRDYDLLARFPPAGFVGQTTVSDTFRAMITAAPKGGTYEARAGADDILRTFSYHAVGEYPLITVVGLAIDDYLAAWRRELIQLSGLAVLFAVVTGVGGHVILRGWRALEQKTSDLARSNSDLEQFAYVASHDLQTPLRSIVSYTQLLARRYQGRLGGDADEFVSYIVEGAKRMSALITDLLAYARVSNSDMTAVTVGSARALDAAMARLHDTIKDSGARITVGALPEVAADLLQVTSLFENLIQNAIRFHHPDRPPEITIGSTGDAHSMWRFFVRDNGIGIDKTYFDKVFIMFQRLEPARFPTGTGIGLAICRSIVGRFGGQIWIESVPDQETTVFFTLPAAPTGHFAPTSQPTPLGTPPKRAAPQ